MGKQEFIQIVNTNRGIIRSLCKAYYTGTEDQKDAFQDVVLQLWKSFDSFRGESAVKTWIYSVSLKTILTGIRKRKKSVLTEPVEHQHTYVSTSGADDNIELLAIILKSLQEMDKAILLLRLEGYRNKEIAEMLSLSPTNISTRFNRLKTELKKKFNNKPHATKQS